MLSLTLLMAITFLPVTVSATPSIRQGATNVATAPIAVAPLDANSHSGNSTNNGHHHHHNADSYSYGINTTLQSGADTYSRYWDVFTSKPSSYAGSGVWYCGGTTVCTLVDSTCSQTHVSDDFFNCDDPSGSNGATYYFCVSVPSSIGSYAGNVIVYKYNTTDQGWYVSGITETSCQSFTNSD
jgi:hypothetical protein